MAIVYRHRRLDTNDIFYIGIGKEEKRAFSKYKRSTLWYNVVNKTGYDVEIVSKDLSWDDACELEIFLISLYGKKIDNTGKLTNIADGGGGTLGYKHQNRYGRKHSLQTKTKIGASHLGKKYSDEVNKLKGKKNGDHPSARRVIDTITNEVFDCAKDASKKYNINYSTLISKLNGSKRNNTKLKYI